MASQSLHSARAGSGAVPRVLFVSRTRYRLPLQDGLARKFRALQERMEVRVLAAAQAGSRTEEGPFHLVPPVRPRLLDGPLFYLGLPFRVAREIRRFRPHAVVAQSPYEAFAVLAARRVARPAPRLVLEVHGDWRTLTRLYGSPLRRALGPLADAVSALAVRCADGVRAVSGFTAALVRRYGVEPAAIFTTYTDVTTFRERPVRPLPRRPQLLFVGVLERYKNIACLAEAWRTAAPQLPEATLRIVGSGTCTGEVEQLVADVPEQTAWDASLAAHEVVDALDEATALVLPSRSEGLPRVVLEAFCRGRPVIGARAGGIPDAVEDGVNGVLVEGDDRESLAAAMIRVVRDRALVERLAAGAEASCGRWLADPDEYADRMRALVDAVTPLDDEAASPLPRTAEG